MKLFHIAWIGLALLSFDCATVKKSLRPTTEFKTADQVLKYVLERKSKIQTLRCEGEITLETTDESNSGNFVMNLKMPDSLKIDFHGPFGIRAGSLLLSRDNFIFYNPSENTISMSSNYESYSNHFLPPEIDFDDVVNAVIGAPLSLQANDSIDDFYVDDNNYILIYHQNNTYREYRIDRKTMGLNLYIFVDSLKGIDVRINEEQYENGDEVSLPMFVSITVPKREWKLRIATDDFQLNRPVNCTISFPKTAKVINLK